MPDTTARDFLAAMANFRRRGGPTNLFLAYDAFLIAHPTAEDAEKEIGRAARSDRAGLPDDADESKWTLGDLLAANTIEFRNRLPVHEALGGFGRRVIEHTKGDDIAWMDGNARYLIDVLIHHITDAAEARPQEQPVVKDCEQCASREKIEEVRRRGY